MEKLNRDVNHPMSTMLVAMLAVIYLVVMHLVIPNMGGTGSELPTSLWVWFCLLMMLGYGWSSLIRITLILTPGTRWIMFGTLLMTVPLAWSPGVGWRLEALPRFAGLWGGVCLLLLMTNCRFSLRQQQILLYLVALAGLIQAVYSLLGLHLPLVLPQFEQQVLAASPGNISVFQQRNVAGSFLACGAAVWLYSMGSPLFRCQSPRLERWRVALASAAILVMFCALTEIQSRIGWLSALGVYGAMACLYWRGNSVWRRSVLLGLPVVGFFVGALMMPISLAEALAQHEGSTLQRLMILHETIRMIAEHPLSGWGYGSYVWHFSHFIADRAVPIANGRRVIPHPHNEILYWWVEGGIVALLGLVMMAWAGGVIFLRRTTRSRLSLLCCLLPLLLHTQVEYPFYQSAAHWLTFILLLSLASAEQTAAHTLTFSRFPWFPTLILSGVCLWAFVVLATLRQQEILTGFEQRPDNYYREVLTLHETGLGIERLKKDRAQALIVEYQHSGDRQALLAFTTQAGNWLNSWVDDDMYDNLINVNLFLGNTLAGQALKFEAQRLFSEEPRYQ